MFYLIAHAFKIPPHLGIELTQMVFFAISFDRKTVFVQLTCSHCVLV